MNPYQTGNLRCLADNIVRMADRIAEQGRRSRKVRPLLAVLCLAWTIAVAAPVAAVAAPAGALAAPAGALAARAGALAAPAVAVAGPLLRELVARPGREGPQRLVDALSQQGMDTGSIEGLVRDFDGTPLPGVVVRIIGPKPSVSERTTVSTDEARYEFVGLTPGVYRLAVELPSIQAGGDIEVTVRPGMRVTTDLELSLMGTDVTVTVQAVATAIGGFLSRGEIGGQSTVDYDTLSSLPLPAEQALQVLPLIPTVLRDLEDNISIGGTYPADAILLFNGMDLMDPFTGSFRLRLPLEAVEDVGVFTGVYPATYGDVTGGIVDISTTPGGSEWAWKISSIFPRPNFHNGSIQGVGNYSPRFFVGGPVGDGGLYLAQSGEYHLDRLTIDDVAGRADKGQIKTQGWESLTQFDWYPNDNHRVRFSLLIFPALDEYIGLDALTPAESTINVERDGEALLGNHRWTIDERSSLQWALQINRIGIGTSAQGPNPLEVIPDGVRGNFFRTEDRETTHTQVRAVYGRSIGDGGDTHLIEVGGELHNLAIKGEFHPDTILVRGADDQLLQRIDFVGGVGLLDNSKYEWAGFVHDRWWHSSRFWCDLGFRYSSDSVTRQTRLNPRAGIAWDPTGNSATLIKVAAGLLHRRVYLAEALWDLQPTRIETTFNEGENGEDVVRAFVPRTAGRLKAPRTLLTTAEVIHDFSPSLLVRGRYTRRDGSDQIVFDPLAAGGVILPDGIEPSDPTFAMDVASMDDPDARGSMLLSNDGRLLSWSAEITTRYRFSGESELYGSYAYSSAEGDLNQFSRVAGEMPDPIIRPNAYSRLPFDAPHRFLLWGVLQLPWKLTLSPVVEWRSGFPYSVVQEDQSYLGEANSARYPAFLSIDAQITKDFRIKKYDITAGVKVTNLTDHYNPRNVISNVASQRFGDLLNSRGLKLRARISFGF